MYVCMHVCTDILHKSGTKNIWRTKDLEWGSLAQRWETMGNLFQKKYKK